MTTDGRLPAMRPGRRIEGISAVLLPYGADGRPDLPTFLRLLDRTWNAGLTPAVNMDTGYVNLLDSGERQQILDETAGAAAGRPFVAGAYVEDLTGEPVALYGRQVEAIRRGGGTPILFQCSTVGRMSERDALDVYRRVAEAGSPLLAFELGTMFAPFGRIHGGDFFRELLDIPAFVGLKHSSLDRTIEWERLRLRDAYRPDFRVYTGNDLAIDMVFYGSDYLLGLSAFWPEAFARRDALWAASDPRVFGLNDLLQYLGFLAFRAPVPAYKHSAAQFLHGRGVIPTSRPNPRSPTRPESDVPLLRDIAERIEAFLEPRET